MRESSVDLPAFGKPIKPTSASSLSERRRLQRLRTAARLREVGSLAGRRLEVDSCPSRRARRLATVIALLARRAARSASRGVGLSGRLRRRRRSALPTGTRISIGAVGVRAAARPCRLRRASALSSRLWRKRLERAQAAIGDEATSPPRPPSPPSGPPRATNFSRRNEARAVAAAPGGHCDRDFVDEAL